MKEKAEAYTAIPSCQAEAEALPTTETAEVEETEPGPTDEHLAKRIPKNTNY